MGDSGQRLFVGNLPPNTSEADLQHEFNAYGECRNANLRSVQLMNENSLFYTQVK